MFRRTVRRLACIASLALCAVTACKKDGPVVAPPPAGTATVAAEAAPKPLDRSQLAVFAPLPADFATNANPCTDARVALGQLLYHDKRLSKNHDLACSSCHALATGGADGKPTSPGHKGQLGDRNSPTVLNAAGHVAQFWDGRAGTIEDQAKGPILNPVEMAMPGAERVIVVLKSIPEYVTRFQAAFPGEADAVTYDNVAKAIGAFERKLVTPCRWDKYLGGDEQALNDVEKRGAAEFVAAGCAACHSGVLVGGGMYQKVGLVKPWPNQKDLGRFNVTKSEADKLQFKVPSLRNIARTAPYFHDGSVASLEQAIRMMGEHQLGKQLTGEQVRVIAAWLGALSGDLPQALVAEPALPPSSPSTPAPDPT